MLCLSYGAHEALFSDVVERGYLPKSRAINCKREYNRLPLHFTILSHHIWIKRSRGRSWIGNGFLRPRCARQRSDLKRVNSCESWCVLVIKALHRGRKANGDRRSSVSVPTTGACVGRRICARLPGQWLSHVPASGFLPMPPAPHPSQTGQWRAPRPTYSPGLAIRYRSRGRPAIAATCVGQKRARRAHPSLDLKPHLIFRCRASMAKPSCPLLLHLGVNLPVSREALDAP